MPALLDDASHGVLLKEQLASALEQVIVTGRPHARHRVAETIWPQEFSVAQASVQRDIDFHIALTSAPGNPVLAEIGAKFLFPLLRLFRSASSRASKNRTLGSATCRITVWCCT